MFTIKIPKVLIFSLVLMLAGCATVVRMAYNNADFFVVRSVDGYLDLNAEQKRELSARINELMAEHRNEELPKYVTFIEDLKVMAGDELTQEELESIMDTFEGLYREVVTLAMPIATATLLDLSDEQIDFLAKKMEENDEETREELAATPEERRERRVKETIDALKGWTGRLSDDQEALVQRLSVKLPDNDDAWYEYGIKQKAQLIGMLKAGTDQESLSQFLSSWWLGEDEQGQQVTQSVEDMRPLVQDMMLQVDQSLTQQQRDRALRRLDRYYRAFSGLVEAEPAIASVADAL